MSRTALVAAAVVIALPLSLRADQWDAQVRLQMLGTAVGAIANGYTLADRMEVGSLRDGGTRSFTVNVRAGVQYLLVANCDADCDDVDLVLSERDGREIAADRRDNDLAIVAVPAGHPGAHTVTVSMASCRSNPCRFGLGLFTR